MDNYIDIFIKNKSNEISSDYIEYINKYLPFYADIPSDDLAYIFAYFHYKFNNLFQFINEKININRHYNADESRELILLISSEQQLSKELKDSAYEYNINSNYFKSITMCNDFLIGSGGSTIPDDIINIDIVESKPIFSMKNLDLKVSTDKPKIKQYAKVQNTKISNSKVFIVHGHDNETKQEVARFIEKIGLQTIILHEQANSGMTIIEKIEYYTEESSFAIVLYTPCDKGRGALETTVQARDRARQNVVFEHGYLMAKIGRKNVFALVKGEIETPSDISGVVYTPFDVAGGWKNKLIQELKVCGYKPKAI